MCALDYGKAETHIVLLLSPQKSDRSTDVQPRTADANWAVERSFAYLPEFSVVGG